jgi:hypothetical protein
MAEVAADGSSVITKHERTGGLVSVGTVTAQLLYEIGGPRYANPDVVARLDSIRLADEGPDRVRIDGVKGEPPPATTKVAATVLAGFRNSVTFVIPGLDVEAKATLAEDALWERTGGRDRFADVDVQLIRSDHEDPESHEASFAYLKVTVADPDPVRVGRAFSNAAIELALASYPGFLVTAPPGKESPLVIYWPALVPQVASEVTCGDATASVAPTPHTPGDAELPDAAVLPPPPDGPTVRLPLGRVVAGRSGDKGGDANLGLWVRSDDAFAWLVHELTPERLRALVPEARALEVTRHVLANLRAVNFVLHGYLGEGVSSSPKLDPQAKALAEYVRARIWDIPETLVAS